jgi:hypothetical protein
VDSLTELAGADVGEPAPAPAAEHAHHSHDDVGDGGNVNGDLGVINASTGEIPDIEMIDVSSGATVNLRAMIDNDKALLFWFWAPH